MAIGRKTQLRLAKKCPSIVGLRIFLSTHKDETIYGDWTRFFERLIELLQGCVFKGDKK